MMLENKISSIEYMKSALSVNTHFGCALGCGYCIVNYTMGADKEFNIRNPYQLLDELIDSKLFVKNKTLLSINNKTDPLLNRVRKDTFQFINLLRENGLQNPLMLISKLALRESDLELLEDYPGRIYFFTSYSGMPKEIEPISGIQLNNLNILKKRKKVDSIHYWRPLIKGLNDSNENIKFLLESVQDSCDCSVVSGIRLSPYLVKTLKNYGANFVGWDGDTSHKYLDKGIVSNIIDIRNSNFPDYPLFKKTSCSIAYLSNLSDYNFNFLKENCDSFQNCKNQNVCNLRKLPTSEEIIEKRNLLGISNDFEPKADYILFKGKLNSDEKSFLNFNLRYPVESEEFIQSHFEGAKSNADRNYV